MEVFLIALIYLVLHFSLYALAGRRSVALRSEKGIFLLHVTSMCLALTAAAAYALSYDRAHAVPIVFGIAALHGIYSLSFLELWSLCEGSYSKDVIEGVLSGLTRENEVVVRLALIGDRKKAARLGGLEKLRLVAVSGPAGVARLRTAGIGVSIGLRFLRWVANLKSTG
jgi:hypothetical protein